MLATLMQKVARPAPFEPSEAPFWDDPYIAQVLLANHLDDSHAMASRPRAVIRESVEHLVGLSLVQPGTRVLDLGCGPGLVATELAKCGAHVTGVDISQSSIEYARAQAAANGLEIDYRVQDFLTLDAAAGFDLILQSFGELSTFAPAERDDLLGRVHRALAPGGAFVFDVSTPALRGTPERSWQLETGGLWRVGPHLVLTESFHYAQEHLDDLICEQYLVSDDQGVTAYRMWFQDYTRATIGPILAARGFTVDAQWDSLTGELADGSPWLAILARQA